MTEVFKHLADSYLIINDQLKITANHPVMINRRWQDIGIAKIGDKLKTRTGQVTIYSIKEIQQPTEVYNLEVNGNHNYYAEDYLVHNKLNRFEDLIL